VITGTLGYDEPHKMTADARAVVMLVDVTAGPMTAPSSRRPRSRTPARSP
jgi:hypothetical protein